MSDEKKLIYISTERPELKGAAAWHGISVESHSLIPRDQVLIVNPGALKLEVEDLELTPDPYESAIADQVRYRAESAMSMRLRRTVVESDPLFKPMPVVLVNSWRELPSALWKVLRNHVRRAGQIIGYEYRKGTGELRHHADPRDFAVITGLDA